MFRSLDYLVVFTLIFPPLFGMEENNINIKKIEPRNKIIVLKESHLTEEDDLILPRWSVKRADESNYRLYGIHWDSKKNIVKSFHPIDDLFSSEKDEREWRSKFYEKNEEERKLWTNNFFDKNLGEYKDAIYIPFCKRLNLKEEQANVLWQEMLCSFCRPGDVKCLLFKKDDRPIGFFVTDRGNRFPLVFTIAMCAAKSMKTVVNFLVRQAFPLIKEVRYCIPPCMKNFANEVGWECVKIVENPERVGATLFIEKDQPQYLFKQTIGE